MEGFVKVARKEQIPPGTGIAVEVAGTSIAVFNLGHVSALGAWDKEGTSPKAVASLLVRAFEEHCTTPVAG